MGRISEIEYASDLNSERYDAQAECNTLKQEREKLLKEIADLKIKISDLLMEKTASSQTDKDKEVEEEEGEEE